MLCSSVTLLWLCELISPFASATIVSIFTPLTLSRPYRLLLTRLSWLEWQCGRGMRASEAVLSSEELKNHVCLASKSWSKTQSSVYTHALWLKKLFTHNVTQLRNYLHQNQDKFGYIASPWAWWVMSFSTTQIQNNLRTRPTVAVKIPMAFCRGGDKQWPTR